MKVFRFSLLVGFFTLSFVTNLFAQDVCENVRNNNNKDFAVSLDLGGLIAGGLGAQLDYRINSFLIATFNIGVQSRSISPLPSIALSAIQAYRPTMIPSLSVNPALGAMFIYQGFYAEPRITLGLTRFSPPMMANTKNYFVIKPSAIFGYRKIFASGFYLNLGLGVAVKTHPGNSWPSTAIQPDAVLGLGYAF